MNSMFRDCYSLMKLKLPSFSDNNITDVYNMFDRCMNLYSCGCTKREILLEFENRE